MKNTVFHRCLCATALTDSESRSGKTVQICWGVNESRQATCFPAEVTAAGSWDFSLTEAIGKAVGEEARGQGVGLVLGPGANLKRNPLCGRNFEYFSEDPYLVGKLAGRGHCQSALWQGQPLRQADGELASHL